MQFRKLANLLIKEAKDERPGQRFMNVQNRQGPSGISSSPIGRDDYNPEIVKPVRPAFKDEFTGTEQAVAGRNTDIILKNAFRLIKSDAGFRKQINLVIEAFAKKRKSITMAQEKVLTLNPAHIDKLYSQIVRLEKIVAALEDDPRAKKFIAELDKLTAQHAAVTEQLDGVIEDVKDILGVNEEASLKAQDAVIKLIQTTAQEQYEALVKGLSDEEKATIILRSLDQLEAVNFSEEALEQEELRIQLLSALLSEELRSYHRK
jgi:nucleoside diphosphate kinase